MAHSCIIFFISSFLLLLKLGVTDTLSIQVNTKYGYIKLKSILVFCIILAGFCYLTKNRVTWEVRTSPEELPPSNWPVGITMELFLNCYLL